MKAIDLHSQVAATQEGSPVYLPFPSQDKVDVAAMNGAVSGRGGGCLGGQD